MNPPRALEEYEQQILGWVRGKIGDGLATLKKERGYMEYENSKKFVNGEQFPLRSRAISRLSDNRLRKIVLETIGALTDVRPIWNYDATNYSWKSQGEVLSKLARSWWKTSQSDRRLQSVLTFAMCGGSGYGYLRWNPDQPGGGDFEVIPLGPTDVLPIEPIYSDSIQDWRGAVIRMNFPVETVKQMYPLKSHKIGGSKGSWVAPMTKEGGSLYGVMSSAWATLTRGYEGKQSEPPNTVDVFFIYLKDESLNTGLGTMKMGTPGSNWEYDVPVLGSTDPDTGQKIGEAEARLYPRGRLIVCTQDAVCEDGPNPYWHGMFPLVKFTLEPLPWTILGAPIIGDLIPLQNALNEALRGLEDGMAQWIRRGVIGDRQSISRTTLEAIDTRKAGLKAYLNNNVGGQGFQVVDGPQFPTWYLEFIQYLKNEMDEIAGTKGLKEMAQLKQMPSADTMQKYMESMSPLLRVRARSMEVSLGELAEMLKVGFFQYYDQQRRFEIVGPNGLQVEDFDYDPENLVPSGEVNPQTGMPVKPRWKRAQAHHKNFKFNVAPNSFLNISHSEQKMLILQMFREQIMDPWTLWEAMDIPNVGAPPMERVEDRIIAARQAALMQGPTPELVQLETELKKAQLMLQLQQIQQQAMMGGAPPGPGGPGGPGGPPGGAPPGAPPGGGATAPPPGREGRPPSGQQAPKMETRPGNDGSGPRTVVSESG
jgi:hypothetical protein